MSSALNCEFEDSQHSRSRSPPPILPPNINNMSRTSSGNSSGVTSYYNHVEDNPNSDDSSSLSIHDDGSVSPSTPIATGLMFKVQFKSTTDNFNLADSCTRDIAIGDYVKVEADRGHDVGTVSDIFWPSADQVQALAATNNKQILAIASEDEFLLSKGKSRDEARALSICEEIVSARGMQITLVDAEFQYDRKKLTFFFTSDRHTDFRELVRDLFTIFKTRIWMQKIKPFEAVAFHNANLPIPRFNGGAAPSSSSRHQSQSHRQASSHYNTNKPRYQQQHQYHHKIAPIGVENTSTDIYRTQLHLQVKDVTVSSQHVQPSYLRPSTVGSDNHHHNNHQQHQPQQHHYHRQTQGQGQQGYSDYHQQRQEQHQHQHQHQHQYQQYHPPVKLQQPQFHQLQDPYQRQVQREEQQQQQQQQHQGEYTSFSSYASRFSPAGGLESSSNHPSSGGHSSYPHGR